MWMWKANDVLENGLEGPCEFRVTIQPVGKGVKVDLKVTCQVRGRLARDGHHRSTYPL